MDRDGEKRKEGERKGRESGVKEGRWGDRVTEKDVGVEIKRVGGGGGGTKREERVE